MTMLSPASGFTAITGPLLRVLVIYGVLCLQLSAAPTSHGILVAPQWLMIVAAWCLLNSRAHNGGLWVIFIGLLMDITSQHRIGLHLGTCGVLAGLAQLALSERRSTAWWQLPLLSGWFTFGDTVISATLLALIRKQPLEPAALLSQAVRMSVPTACVALLLVAAIGVGRRLLIDPQRRRLWELDNQWARLAEE